jgi:hypothetical protein
MRSWKERQNVVFTDFDPRDLWVRITPVGRQGHLLVLGFKSKFSPETFLLVTFCKVGILLCLLRYLNLFAFPLISLSRHFHFLKAFHRYPSTMLTVCSVRGRGPWYPIKGSLPDDWLRNGPMTNLPELIQVEDSPRDVTADHKDGTWGGCQA